MPDNLVLLGGGHSHAIALRLFGKKPIPGVNLTLITDVIKTPYSGMLPGHVAGFYSYEETHIDLCKLTSFAGAELLLDEAIGLDLEKNLVICKHLSPVEFDYLSIDIGSTPATDSIPGVDRYAIPAKPVPQFLAAWEQLIEQVTTMPKMAIAIVGGGAGGVELALNMHSRLPKHVSIHLFHRNDRLLPNHSDRVGKQLEQILQQRGIYIHLQETVSEVSVDRISCQSGLVVAVDRIFWVTQASAPNWIKQSGLTTDDRGFILVNNFLQSVSHPHIFAAGDIATMQNYSRPKAGVFAVRQGKPLFENWHRITTNRPLKPYIPQKRYLSLIGTGDRRAIASWGKLCWRSPLLWCWKDYIDRQFMNLF
jgi:selenide,water dikinase